MSRDGAIDAATLRSIESENAVHSARLTMEQYNIQQERERLERRARQAMRDAEYRKALGLDGVEPLPKAIGSAGGCRNPQYSKIRATKQMAS